MAAKLKALTDGESFPLSDYNLIGRGEDATLKLADFEVSRQHATIKRDGQHYWLVDLGSANGSFVNDEALAVARVLRAGDRLQFGSSVFLFEQAAVEKPHVSLSDKTQVLFRSPTVLKGQPVTLFVADLKGFTGISAQLAPADVAALLQEWYADCNAIMKDYGATIDKFIGDCLFAYWHGVAPDISVKAVQAAQALRAAELAASSPTRSLLRRQGITLDCGIGLHVGDVAVGAMGKGVNTALGDAVNVAFRIESLTRKLERPLLVSAEFVESLAEAGRYFETCGTHEVKGRPEPVEIFSLRQ